jgi:hypothetical protein
MMTPPFHPAVLQLLGLQSRGRRRRMWGRFCQTRRLVLSTIACALAVVWLGNTAMTIWLRETASPETLRALLSLGMVIYAGWHFAKAAFFRSESPFDWTPTEDELLVAMPLRPRDLVAYQLASVTATTCLKAALFTLLLWPDLRNVSIGLIGVVLAMMCLEMLRLAIDIVTWGIGRLSFLVYRVVVVAGLVAGGCTFGAILLRGDAFNDRINVGEGLLQRFLDILVQSNESALRYATGPFQPFVNLILADSLTGGRIWLAVKCAGIVAVLALAVISLYTSTSRRIAVRQRRAYGTSVAAHALLEGGRSDRLGTTRHDPLAMRLPTIPRWGGAGALAWRQALGARRSWGSLLTAMIAPAVLACAPCFVIEDPYIALLSTTGTLAFYTFLLLPTAIRFDFRRDLDRLATLKGMPITPAAAAIGQTVVPVLVACLFQSCVLAVAVGARSLPPHMLLTTMLVLLPLNLLVFGLENLIYLLYPYRVQQEGLEIFLRTILTFTGKGLLFIAGLGVMSAWGLAAAAVTGGISHWTGSAVNAYAVFTAGMIAGPWLVAAIVLYGLALTYRSMSPIEDLPR